MLPSQTVCFAAVCKAFRTAAGAAAVSKGLGTAALATGLQRRDRAREGKGCELEGKLHTIVDISFHALRRVPVCGRQIHRRM